MNRDARTQHFADIMNHCASYLSSRGISLPGEHLTIVDVGSGRMPYASALEMWACRRAQKVSIIAVDPSYPRSGSGVNGSRIVKVAAHIEEATGELEQLLKQLGVLNVGLITLFNPNPVLPMPNLRTLDGICEATPIIGALDNPGDAPTLAGLRAQGYRVFQAANPDGEKMWKAFGHGYNPMFLAMPRLLS